MKRFTDTDKWRDPWFVDLPPMAKLFWLYLCDNCDAAGVWQVHAGLAEAAIGSRVAIDEVLQALGDRVRLIGDRKLHLVKFVEFQYPRGLSDKSDAQRKVLSLLRRHGLTSHPSSQVETAEVGAKLPPRWEQDKEEDKEEDSNSNARAREPVATPPAEALPLSATKPGILELRTIPGLKLTADSLPAWLVLAEEVGIATIRRARDQVIAAGKECWQADVATAALRLAKATRTEDLDRKVARERQREIAAHEALVEQERQAAFEQAKVLLEAVLAQPGERPPEIERLVVQLRTIIANHDRGSRANGVGSPMPALKAWLVESQKVIA